MRIILRHFFSGIALLLLLGVERSLGVPIFSFTLVTLYTVSLPLIEREVVWFLAGLLIAMVYQTLPFFLILSCLLTLQYVFQQDWKIFKRESIKNMLPILGVATLFAYLIDLPRNWFAFGYFFISILLNFLLLRYWFSEVKRPKNLGLSNRLRKQR
jgi:hypothetical protein